MWINIAALLIVFFFISSVILIFVKDVVSVIANLAVFYVLFIFTRKELLRKKSTYGLCALLSACILLIVGNFLPLWFGTSIALLTIIGVKVYYILGK